MDDQLMVVCGDKVYPSEYGTSYFATKLEKDIIFGSIFTAAPELIVSTNTAFKKIQQSTALAGVQKTSPNTQVGNIVNGLKQAGVWDVEGLEALAQSKGNDGAAAVAKIASFILQRFSQGTQIKLYAVKVISNMLRSGAEPSAIATTLLERDYPSLASYMKDEMGCDDVIDEYMAWYRKNKIINRYPGDYPVQMTFDRFDARYKLMHKLQGQDCMSFWIDGFGSEYTPLFLYELKVQGIVPESVKLATALLPTETEYNHQWDEHDPMTIKWDRLDSFSHKGMPDDKSYYSCIVHQLSVFSDAAKKVEELLENHEYVVVTGDHGSSRFAALAFHQENVVPISAPKKSTVRSFGRSCELDDNAEDVIALPNTVVVTSNGKRYLVMDNYQHFSVSGNAAGGNTDEHDVVGEIHGGNTAEERLVSVIVIKRKQPLPPVTCKPKGGLFVTKKNGHVEKALQFSRPISTLEVSYYNKEAICTMNADGSWLVILDGVTTDDITLSVIANGRLLPNVTLKVKAQGISKNDDPFGGMGL